MSNEKQEPIIAILKEFQDKLEHLVGLYTSSIAEQCNKPIDCYELYDKVCAMNGGERVLDMDSLGFDGYRLIEEAALMTE